MGIKNLLSLLRDKNCFVRFAISERADLMRTLNGLFMICFDFNTVLHKTCAAYMHGQPLAQVDQIRNDLCEELGKRVGSILCCSSPYPDGVVHVIVALDGISPPAKRPTQRKRRRMSASASSLESEWKKQLTAGSEFMSNVFDSDFRRQCVAKMTEQLQYLAFERVVTRIQFVFDSQRLCGEGEIKCFDHILKSASSADGTVAVVTVDNDVIASSLFHHQHIAVMTVLHISRETHESVIVSNQTVRRVLFSEDYNIGCWFAVMLFAVFGGDYLPPLLLSSSSNQMDKLYEAISERTDKLRETSPLQMLDSPDSAKAVCLHVLEIMGHLTKYKKASRANKFRNLDVRASTVISWFLSDLLWVVAYYSRSPLAVLDRKGFLLEVDAEVDLFHALPKNCFASVADMDFEAIYATAFQPRARHRNWKDYTSFAEEVLG